MPKIQMSVRIISCDRSRADAVLAILNEAIENSTALYDYQPRTRAMMDAWYDAKEKARYPVIGVIDEANQLLGFGSYAPFRAWPAYKYTIEHSLYVERAHRGQGVGKLLLAELIATATRQDYHMIIGGIDAQNAASIALHRRLGFEQCAHIRQAGFKFNRWLDLKFYQLLLNTPAHPIDG
ncbi:MAG TPA: GNAT family N-acetyltransferase [Steroidobacteraceae bacterium]|nr:GNAT family N-acetyltransferase [Steroidobacteraceae bacterium]